MVGRTLTADTDISPFLTAGLDGTCQEDLNGFVAFIEEVGNQSGIAVQTECQLGQVVGADRETVEVFKERLAYIEKRVAEIPYLSLPSVAGSMYAFINISKSGLDSVTFVEQVLEKSGVLFVPGRAFGETVGDNYIRLAATQPMEVLAEAFDRLEKLNF